MARKGDWKENEHDRDSASGRFTKMHKQRAAVPAAPAVDLGTERVQVHNTHEELQSGDYQMVRTIPLGERYPDAAAVDPDEERRPVAQSRRTGKSHRQVIATMTDDDLHAYADTLAELSGAGYSPELMAEVMGMTDGRFAALVKAIAERVAR